MVSSMAVPLYQPAWHRKGKERCEKSQSVSKRLCSLLQEQSPGAALQIALQQPPEESDPERRILPKHAELVSILSARVQLGPEHMAAAL